MSYIQGDEYDSRYQSTCCGAKIDTDVKRCAECKEFDEGELIDRLTVTRRLDGSYQAFIADECDVDGVRSGFGATPEEAKQVWHDLHDGPYMERTFQPVAETIKHAAGMLAIVVGLISFFGLSALVQEVFGK